MVWESVIAAAGNIATGLSIYSYYEGKKQASASSRRYEADNTSQANRFVTQAVEDRLGEINYLNPEFLIGNTKFVLDIIRKEARYQPKSNRATIENVFNKYLSNNPYYRGNSFTGRPVFKDRSENADSTSTASSRVNPVPKRQHFTTQHANVITSAGDR